MILNQLSNVNWLAILVAFFVFFMLGYVCYQLLFVKAYKVALGKENEELPKKSTLSLLFNTLNTPKCILSGL